jgi:peptidoglycan/xylan/chitin deacetylase (PgdA/CDA1 family)
MSGATRLVERRHAIADPVVALTFDDGPSPWTLPVADHLERHGGRGTFFAIGEAVATEDGGRIVRSLLQRGHEVGNHTWTHPDLRTLGVVEIQDEMRRTAEALAQTGVTTRLWRAPFFHCDDRVRAAVGDLAGDEVWFSSMPGDWGRPAEETARRVLDDLSPGDIVVLHDGRPANEPPELSWPTRDATVAAVGLILEEMSGRGLRAVTISELVASR